MKTHIFVATSASPVSTLKTPEPKLLLKAAFSRVISLVDREISPAYSLRKTSWTYTGLTEVNLIKEVEQILAPSINAKALFKDMSVSNITAMPTLTDADSNVTLFESRYLDENDESLISIQLYKFAKAKMFGFVLSIKPSK